MPRLSRSVPRYRKHRPSGQAIVTLSGRDHYLGPHGTRVSRHAYDRLVGEWLENGRNPLGVDADTLTVVELLSRYWQYAKGYYLKNGKCTGQLPKIKSAAKVLKERYGRTPAAEFGPLALKACRQKWVDEGLSRTYVNEHVARVVRIFRWAAAEQLVPASVPQALAMVPGLRRGRTDARETAPVMPVDDAVVETTLALLPDVVADMVRLQRLTAMRPAEVCLLRPCDLDRDSEVWTYRPESHKTEHHGRERVVLIGPRGQEILLRYLARDSKAYCFRPCDSESKRRAAAHAVRKTPASYGNGPGTNRKRRPKRSPGERYEVASYRRAIHRACDKAQVERWAPNRLRHTAATEIRAKHGLEAAQIVLGHAGADVTQVYAERDLAKGVEVARKIG